MSTPPEDIALVLRTDPRFLRAVRSLVRCYFSDAGVPEERCQDVVLAIDEACTNAMRHSYGGNTACQLRVGLASDPEWITVVLRDEGCPAAPDRIRPRPPEPVDPEGLTPGGLGVQLIYRVFDEVDYAPGDRVGNRIVMRLRRTAA
jgi:anti-sigma regulatory factor (Ser/Thr protein kinase)